ncbi:MAG: phosphatidate cytidylyltransferase [Phycisphaerae bacterium]
MLSQRLLFGTLLLAAFFGLFWLDAWLEPAASRSEAVVAATSNWVTHLQRGFVVSCVCAILLAVAARELVQLMRGGGHHPFAAWVVGCVAGFAMLPWGLSVAGVSMPVVSEALTLGVLIAAGGALACAARRPQPEKAASDAVFSLFVIVYLGVLGSYVPRLRLAAETPWVVIYVVLVIKSCDIFAYFTGMALGRHKLIPRLSPKKTIEGLAGGVLGAMLVAAGLSALFRDLSPAADGVWPGFVPALVFGGLMALIGQAGDLFESLIKRGVGAKDSAAVVPAFGGILDLIDSVLPCAPAAYWMLVGW